MTNHIKIISVVGARPNFMKVGPLHRAFLRSGRITSVLVHTGQHYDEKMSDIFFNQLELPVPDYYLGIGAGSHAVSTAKIMMAFEEVVLKEQPDLVLVVGDVNSTIACALVASKLLFKVAHVEAGLRSGDRTMPEEINRIVTDSISDLLYVTENSGIENLKQEGVDISKIYFSGNVMIDSLVHYLAKSQEHRFLERLNLTVKTYVLVTMHRPANVDYEDSLNKLLCILERCATDYPVVFPVHPRTASNLKKFGLYSRLESIKNLTLLEPLGYLEFLSLIADARIIVTDSGGIQEESTFLKVPCITLRTTTERPVTVEMGTNVLIPKLDEQLVMAAIFQQLNKDFDQYPIPPLWDGKAAERITDHLLQRLDGGME